MNGDNNTNFHCKEDVPCFSVINAKYKHLTCRLCLCSSGWSGTLCDIHGSMVKKGWTVAAVISDLLSLEVSATDCYPQLVCLECLKKLCEFQMFKDACLVSKATFDMGLQSNAVLVHPINPEGRCGVQGITPEMSGRDKLENNGGQHPNITTEGNRIEDNFTSEFIIKEESIEKSNLRDPLSLEPEQNNMEQDLGEGVTIKAEETQDCSMQFGIDDREYKSKECSFSDSGSPSFCKAQVLGNDENLEGSDNKAKSKKMGVNNPNGSMRVGNASSDGINSEVLSENPAAPLAAISWKCKTCDKCFSQRRYLLLHNRNTHERSKQLLKCDLCPKQFFGKKSLENHMIIHSGTFPFNCTWCKKGFLYKKVAEKHAKLHEGAPFKCDHCGVEFLTRSIISEHIQKEHSICHQCRVCKMRFSGKGEMERHFKMEHIEKNFHCDFCPKKFFKQESLESHRRFHLRHYPVKCNLCLRTFPTENSLQNHLPFHDSENFKFKCDWCDRKFFTQKRVMKHAKVHFGAPFKCDNCGLEFILKGLMSKHIQRKHGKKQHSCSKCKKSYFTSWDLRRHYNRWHTKKLFYCERCSRKFYCKEHLEKHQKIHNRVRRFECKFCCKSFLNEANYQRHMSYHSDEVPFVCDACGKEFTFKRRLKAHLRYVHMVKRHSCGLCLRKFSIESDLKIHMTMHTNERNYMCEICGKTFRQKQGLTVHNRTHTGEKPYCCGMCNKRFTQRSTLTTHIKLYCRKVSDHC